MDTMTALAIMGVWLGYGLAVYSVAFGTKNGEAAGLVGLIGTIAAVGATVIILN